MVKHCQQVKITGIITTKSTCRSFPWHSDFHLTTLLTVYALSEWSSFFLNCDWFLKLSSAIWKLHQELHPKNKIKAESTILAEFEKLCTIERFEEYVTRILNAKSISWTCLEHNHQSAWFCRYGAKSVGGMTKLSGPGLAANDAPGMLMAGGIWAGR